MKHNQFLLFCLSLLLFVSCQEPSTLGGGVLDEDNFHISVIQDFDIKAKTIKSSPPLEFNSQIAYTNFVVGRYLDPQFGLTESEIYTRVLRNTLGLEFTPDFDSITIDSVVMVLAYDTTQLYGPLNAPFHLEVYQITEDFTGLDSIYSDKTLMTSFMPLGTLDFNLDPLSNVSVFEPDSGKIITQQPQIRIPLQLPPNVLTSAAFANDTAFGEVFKGVNIRGYSLNNDAVLPILHSGANDGAEGSYGIVIYYTEDDTLKDSYRIIYSTRRFSHTKSGFYETANADVIDDYEAGEEILYLQAMDGPGIEILFNDLRTKLAGKQINKAELSIYIENLPGENLSLYPPIDQVVATYKSGDAIVPIDDIRVFVNDLTVTTSANLASIQTFFGGSLASESGNMIYKLNLTNHIKRLMSDETLTPHIILNPYIRRSRVDRSVIAGPKNATKPMKLKITFTEPK